MGATASVCGAVSSSGGGGWVPPVYSKDAMELTEVLRKDGYLSTSIKTKDLLNIIPEFKSEDLSSEQLQLDAITKFSIVDEMKWMFDGTFTITIEGTISDDAAKILAQRMGCTDQVEIKRKDGKFSLSFDVSEKAFESAVAKYYQWLPKLCGWHERYAVHGDDSWRHTTSFLYIQDENSVPIESLVPWSRYGVKVVENKKLKIKGMHKVRVIEIKEGSFKEAVGSCGDGSATGQTKKMSLF